MHDLLSLLVILLVLPLLSLLLLGRLWLWVSNHDTHARICTRHLSILLKKARVLYLRVAIPELVLGLGIRSLFILLILVFGVFFLFDHRLDLIILKLTVARVVLRVRQGQDVATLI